MAPAQLGPVLRHLRRLAGAPPLRGLTDGQLLQRFAAGREEAAFTALVQRHGRLVWAVCRQVLGREHDAEDAFQATFLVLARHAGSIRRTEAVGSWLYRVAHRIATRAGMDMARRRAHEKQAAARPAGGPPSEAAWRELQAILSDELERLPEKHRAPFVLCCLEGKSRPEAARQLGWKEGTLSGRLAQARKQLRQRLARRGVALPAVLCASALSLQAVAAPAALVKATVKQSVRFAADKAAGVVPGPVAALVEGASKGLAGTNLKIATLVLVVGVLAAGLAMPLCRETAAQVSPAQQLQGKGRPTKKGSGPVPSDASKDKHGDVMTVTGRVLDPDEKPLAGAKLHLMCPSQEGAGTAKPRLRGLSGKDGRFRFTFARSEAFDEPPLRGREEPWRWFEVVATADGYGPDWAGFSQIAQGDVTLRLAKDDVPIRGRILDLQGRPVAGAAIRLLRKGEGMDVSWAGPPQTMATDRDGRFRLTGVGREREVVLRVEGPSIETKDVRVQTRTASTSPKAYPATFEHFAGPTKPIVGTIRDRATRKPLAGVVISASSEGGTHKYNRNVRAVTDDQGRYRLIGLPKMARYELWVEPRAGQNYLPTIQGAADRHGLKPVTVDMNLRRGVLVRCRLIDKVTRKPVSGCHIQYDALYTNPLRSEAYFPLYAGNAVRADREGFVNFVAFPGPGLVFVFGNYGPVRYLPARIDPADKKAYPLLDKIPFTNGGMQGVVENPVCPAYRLINSDQTDKTLAFDIELDPGRPPQKGSVRAAEVRDLDEVRAKAVADKK
jgi:RNA polymerase sigma factor (sigma-70 family)